MAQLAFPDLTLALPEIFLGAAAMVLLMVGVFSKESTAARTVSYASILVLLFTIVLLLSLAFLLLMDRKVWAAVMMRKGPNVVGPFGLLQSFADMLKFVLKEIVVPAGADKTGILLAPIITVILAFMAWAVIPFAPGWVMSDLNVGILYIFAVSSLGVYGIIMGGWASNSKYPFLGALRSAAQMVSYEVSMGFVIVTVLLSAGSLNLSVIVNAQKDMWFVIPLFPMAVIFFVSTLAETNRHPFDMAEAESELVAGFNVEYSAMTFALFFLGEYANMIMMSGLTTILFLGGWLPPFDFAPFTWLPGVFWFVLKLSMVFFMFAMVKAFVPRYRYDQLMRLGWKIFLPTSLVAVVLVAGWRVAVEAGLI